MRSRRLATATLLGALFGATALVACSSDTKSPAPAGSSAPATGSSSPSASSPAAAALKSPFTGLPVATLDRVVALKIDNSKYARPYFVGLDRADIVYEELVEGGTTRMLAVFSSRPAPKVGPIRSVRENDLELLAQYGRVLFGFSGGNTGVKASVHAAPVIDVSYDAIPSAYQKGKKRPDAYNFFTSPDQLRTMRPEGVAAQDIGLRFSELPAGSPTTPATKVSVTWSQRAVSAFRYDGLSHAWLRSMDGVASTLDGGARLGFTNVIVQYVSVRGSRYTDVTGERSPYTSTIGSGRVQVFRDGQVVAGRWSRANSKAGTRYLDAAGHDITLRPGPIWVLLVPNTLSASVR